MAFVNVAVPLRTNLPSGRARRALALLPASLALAAALALPPVALAHDRRVVGPYSLVVGFLEEPAYIGERNAIELKVTRADTGAPVEGLEKTVKASIAFGGGTARELPLHPWAGTPGGYLADVIPTRAGSYRFRFTGTVGGTRIDEEFESGPGRFAEVEVADRLQFPEVVAAPASVAQAARRADERASAVEASLDAVSNQAAAARITGIAGIVTGVAGLAAGVLALVRGRRA